MPTGIYLAHLNPVTNAHVEIINDLLMEKDQIVVMPVRFLKQDQEINSKSFPFNFEINDITFVYREKRIKTKVRA